MSEHLPREQNFLGLPEEYSSPESARVVVIPVPFDETLTYGHGAAAGPKAILEASQQVELFDAVLALRPHEVAGGVATLNPLDTQGLCGETLCERLRQDVRAWLTRGKFVIVLGGEHTSAVGSIKAHCETWDQLTVVQLDAHSDLRQNYLGSPWNHACAMARVLDFHDHLVQVGIRSQEEEERRVSEQLGLPVFYAHDIHLLEEGGADWADRVVSATRRRVYITLDCDVMDPSAMPATGTPEPGGLTWWHLDRLLERLCTAREVVGLDVTELAPIEDLAFPQFTIAKLIARFLGYRFRRS